MNSLRMNIYKGGNNMQEVKKENNLEMRPYTIADWLNSEATDEQFAETFALLGMMMTGRKIEQIYEQENIIRDMNVEAVTNRLHSILEEIKSAKE